MMLIILLSFIKAICISSLENDIFVFCTFFNCFLFLVCVCVCVCVCVFCRPHLWHMEIPQLGVKSELLLPAYARATATPDPSCICNLHYSSQQRRIFNSLSKARDWTCNIMVPSQIHFYCTTIRTLIVFFFILNCMSCLGILEIPCWLHYLKIFSPVL